MTDRKLVLFFFFIVALGLNALTVPLHINNSTGLHQDKTLIKTPSDVASPRISEIVFDGEFSPVDFPIVVRKTFFSYEFVAGTSDKKSVILSINSQGPPAV